MKNVRLFTVLTFFLLGSAFMSAQASRTWVSGVGDDANPCSRTAPCKTFAGAISKTAAGGEIDALDPAGYGAVTITKGMTIDGGGGQVASVLVSGTNGIVVQAGPSDVVILRNLRINGIGTGINGIRFLSGKALIVENCDIFGFTNNGIDIASSGGQVFVTGTSTTNNGRAGLEVESTVNTFVSISKSNFELGTYGVYSGSNSRITVTDSNAFGNSSVGFIAAAGSGSAELSLANCTAASNNEGIQAGGSAAVSKVRVSGVALHGNTVGFQTSTNGTISSFGNNYNSGTGVPTPPNLTPQ